MAGSVNKIVLVGNVGKDPEVRTTQDGSKIVQFSLVTSETWNDKASGERKERAEWHRVVVFNERIGDVVEKYVRKGSKVYVEGQLQTRAWEKDGENRYSTEIVVRELSMLSGRPGTGAAAAPLSGIAAEEQAARVNAEISDDDIPF